MDMMPLTTAPYKACVEWDQSTFYAFQASRDPALVAADEARLQQIFNAAISPTFRQAYDWAVKNDVKFFIDHTLQRAGAYYVMGTGVVGIAAHNTYDAVIAEPLLSHEIRHGWQDKQGFIPTIGRHFAEYFMQIALLEADALAFERVTRSEDELLCSAFVRGDTPRLLIPQALKLAQYFETWTASRGALYGETAARHFGNRLGISGITPCDFAMSYQPFKNGGCPQLKGIDVTDINKVLAIGAGFEGVDNYLDNPKMHAYLKNKLLKPALAQKFYAANANLPPLVKEVNKRFRRAQIAHRKKTGQDLYL